LAIVPLTARRPRADRDAGTVWSRLAGLVRLRLRPLLVALSFLSFVAVGGVATAWLPVLLRQGVRLQTLSGAALLAGAAFVAWLLTAVRRPGPVWGGALVGLFLLALPVSLLPLAPPLLVALLGALLGGLGVAVTLGATRALAGGPDTPGQDLAQVLGVSALGLALGLGLPHLGPVAAGGYDGLARLAGLLAAGVGACVLIGLRLEAVDAADEPLRASPPRVAALGAALGAMLLLGQTVVVRALGESVLARPVFWAGVLSAAGVALARVAAKGALDADLGWRRSAQASGLAFAVLGLLAPRLPAAFVFTEAVVRPSAAGWVVALVLRVATVAVLGAPVIFVAATALGCSARDAVRSTSNGGRWLAGLAAGGALGWALASVLLGQGTLEWLWALAAVVAIAAASWERVDLVPAVLVVLVLALGSGWQADLARAGSAVQWRRVMPSGVDTAQPIAADLWGAASLHEREGRRAVRAGGHVELVLGKATERALLGVHAALLTGAGQARSALVLGVSPGVVEALRAHGVKEIDVVAPAPLLAAAKQAGVDLGGATTHAAELRPFLEAATREWDLIVVLPAKPGTALSRGLFTLEAWQAARRRLSPAGQLVQRVDLLESNTTLVQTALRTLRIVFPVGTTVGGVGEVSFIVSGVSPVLEPDRLAARMQAPDVARALEPLELASPVALLAWQVHSTEGQVRFAGPGPAASDRRPLLDLGVPLAAFTDEVVELGDERSISGPTGLALAQLAADGQLGKTGFETIHRALARHYAAWEPLVRSSAEAWLAADPLSTPALVAVARSALAQNDVSTAVELLAPRLKDEAPPAELVTVALEAMTAQVGRESAVFRPVERAALLELGRRTLERRRDHQGLAAALRALEATP
jgi:spermidine synthase